MAAAGGAGPVTPIPVSVVVMTRNEADNLPRCLQALTRFAQVWVVDSDSDDGTPALAQAAGAEVVNFRWNGRYPKKKQWCLDTLAFACDWVLFVDADEVVTAALADEIAARAIPSSPHAGYFIDGRYEFLGRPLRFGHRNRKLALFDRRRAVFEACPDLHVPRMWEVEGHYQPRIDGSVGRLSSYLWHADRKPLFALFDRHNRYSDWEAQLAEDGSVRTIHREERLGRRLAKSLFRGFPFRYLLVFGYCYVWRLGFLDGLPGLHFALFRTFYYWQVAVKRHALRNGPPPS